MAAPRGAIFERIRVIMRRDLKLGNDIAITESTPFSGGDADIDSLDILLMLASIEKEFGIKINNAQMGQKLFQNVGTLVDYLTSQTGGNGHALAAPAPSPADLLNRLPHRHPFRFVSRLDSVEPGRAASGVWSISGKEDFLAGHFPGRPIVPGVLIAEALAQLSGLAANSPQGQGRLAHVDVRFESAVVPPAEIQLQSQVARSVGSLAEYQVQATCQGAVVARGTITLSWITGAQ